MALNAEEQLNLISQGFTNLTNDLASVIYQTAIETITEFKQTQKDTSPGGVLNENANNYLQKMNSIFNQVFQGNRRVTSRLTQVMVANIGVNVAQDFATVQGAPQLTVLQYFDDNMLPVLEDFANVTPDEKAEYDGLA